MPYAVLPWDKMNRVLWHANAALGANRPSALEMRIQLKIFLSPNAPGAPLVARRPPSATSLGAIADTLLFPPTPRGMIIDNEYSSLPSRNVRAHSTVLAAQVSVLHSPEAVLGFRASYNAARRTYTFSGCSISAMR